MKLIKIVKHPISASFFASVCLVFSVWLILPFPFHIKHIIVLFIMISALIFLFGFIYISKPIKKLYVKFSKIQGNHIQNKSIFTNNIEMLEKGFTELNDARNQEIDHLKTLETYRRDYIGNISHELKTPLFNIQGYVTTILDDDAMENQLKNNFLKKADKNIDRMLDILNDLQTISQYESGYLLLNITTFNIIELIIEVLETEEQQFVKNQITYNLYNSKDKVILVNADKLRIKQVLNNLILNSIKYGKPNGNTTIRVYDFPNLVSIEISDNGIGIDSKYKNRIFERFFREDTSRSREKGGSGLGLAIVKHIIEAHNQNINVISTKGAGSTFTFSLSKG